MYFVLHFLKVEKTKVILNYTNDSNGRNHKTTFTYIKARLHRTLATISLQCWDFISDITMIKLLIDF